MKHMPRFFVPGPLIIDQDLVLDDPQSHHVLAVLRLSEGDLLYLFNGEEGEYLCRVVRTQKRQCWVCPQEKIRASEKLPPLHLFFSPVKGHRTDLILEKGTELGVTHFHPCEFEYSMMKYFKADKAQLQCIQAVQQCGRLQPPVVYAPEKITSALHAAQGMQIALCDVIATRSSWKDLVWDKAKPTAIIVGPEGGISPDERKQFLKLDYIQSLSLGNTVLRAETAVIAALAVVRSLVFSS